MRPSIPELRAARALHRWLRRAALAAVPIVGLTACGDNCEVTPNFRSSSILPASVAWAPGSVHGSEECNRYCPSEYVCWHNDWDHCVVGADGKALACTGTQTFCGSRPCGRLPSGLLSASIIQASVVATELAAAVHLEGAAVFAFQALERELLGHGAPEELVRRAGFAQDDERRHQSSMSRLARRRGARVSPVVVDPAPVRTLLEVARENAREGCVREAYGAGVAAFQGEWAGDPVIRRAMRSIAIDEAEHASLGWAVDAWARSRLARAQRAILDDEIAQAVFDLRNEIVRPVAPEVISLLGMPGPAPAAALSLALAPLWKA